MQLAVVGAGPTGLYLAMGFARRGHRVAIIDRDTGPRPDGTWGRRGVMQFHHPHAFRQQVREALLAELPEVYDHLVAAGAEPAHVEGAPDDLVMLRCRRSTFEGVLREDALRHPGITLVNGHADQPVAAHGRAVGVRVGDRSVDADLVKDAS